MNAQYLGSWLLQELWVDRVWPSDKISAWLNFPSRLQVRVVRGMDACLFGLLIPKVQRLRLLELEATSEILSYE